MSLYSLIDYIQERVAIEKDAANWSKSLTPQVRKLSAGNGAFFFTPKTDGTNVIGPLAATPNQTPESKGVGQPGPADHPAEIGPVARAEQPTDLPAGPAQLASSALLKRLGDANVLFSVLSRGAVAQPLSRHGRVSLVLEPGEGQRDIPRQRIATLQLAIRLNQVPRGRAARHSLLGDLMEKNLIEVFGQRDSARREARSPGSTLRTARSLKRRSGSLAATLLTRRSSAFSRKPRDACFARQRLRS